MQKSFALIAKIKPAHFSNEVRGKFVDSLRQCVRVHRARSRADPCGGELKLNHVVLFRVGSVKKKVKLYASLRLKNNRYVYVQLEQTQCSDA